MSDLHIPDLTTLLTDEQREVMFLSPGARLGHDNREAVRAWLLNHVGGTNRECSAALGLSIMAVGRHVAKLRSEWVAS